MLVVLSATFILVDLFVAIMQVTVSVEIMQLEVSAPFMQVKVSTANMWVTIFIENMHAGLFPGKSAASAFNNKIELFEKAEGQGPGVFRLLGFRFLGYETPPEMLKWEHLTINKCLVKAKDYLWRLE